MPLEPKGLPNTAPREKNSENAMAQSMHEKAGCDTASAREQVVPASQFSAEIYGSFWIGETEFALPVGVIKEVVNEPEDVSAVPLSPLYMIGLFNLRGMIVPIVDLRILLDFPATENSRMCKVAIIESGDLCLGLMFDETGEILNDQGASRVNFRTTHSSKKDVVIEGVLKFDNGKRMVQILDPYEILKIEKIPRASSEVDQSIQQRNLGKRLTCISFQVAHTTCAIDLRYVQEVMDMPDVDRSFLSDGYTLGTANLRGTTLPVVDFRKFIGDKASFPFESVALTSRKLLVMNTPKGPIGLMVYSIDSIIPYFERDILPFTKIALPRGDIVTGCLLDDTNEIVMMLDHSHLMNDEDLVSVANSCQEIHPPKTSDDYKTQDDATSERRTFILFSVDRRFALNISHVCEVINRPEKLLEPPYALSFVEGITNLRGDLITVINPRLLYGLSRIDGKDPKILIFQTGGQKYGILVDSVDEIVMTTDKNVVDMPAIDQHNISRKISEDVSECLRSTRRDPDGTPVMILDIASLVSRCLQIRNSQGYDSEDSTDCQEIFPCNPDGLSNDLPAQS